MAEKYEKTDKVMVMTLEQLAELEKLWVTVHDSLKILNIYIEHEGKQFKLNEAENLLEVREAIGNAQNIAKDKWATLGSAIRHFSGLKLQ